MFVPSTPLLLPENVGLVDPAATIRATAVEAIADAVAAADTALIVCPTDGVTHRAGPCLGERVGRFLLAQAGWGGATECLVAGVDSASGADPDMGPPVAAGSDGTVLVVVGDGTATRTEKAPGHLDDRAVGYDETILRALAAADAAALAGLDADLGAQLWASGVPALRRAGKLTRHTESLHGELRWAGDPWGVQYWIALWRAGPG